MWPHQAIELRPINIALDSIDFGIFDVQLQFVVYVLCHNYTFEPIIIMMAQSNAESSMESIKVNVLAVRMVLYERTLVSLQMCLT